MKRKRLLALMSTLLIGATSASTFVGCGGAGGSKIELDPNKANLLVATFNGGVGYEWLEEAAARFEAIYANSTHFEEGKTGVKIHVDKNKDSYKGGQLLEKTLKMDVYFTEGVEYYSFINKGKVADITDIVSGENSSLEAYGESGKIADKIDKNFDGYLTSATGGKYYMLPFYDGFYGFVYDIELFEEYGFFMDKDGDFARLRIDKETMTEEEIEAARVEYNANKSNGPDGEFGTYDDGLPATYEEMIAMCDRIVEMGCIPFCYSGQYSDYVSKACRAFAVDYEGYEGYSMNYTFNGTATLVADVEDDGSLLGNVKTEEVQINESNGYEIQRQVGKYYALKMQEELFGSTKYIGTQQGNVWNSFSFTVAQAEFIKSKYSSKPYAMLADGVWWENEATSAFKDFESTTGESKEDRRFGWLPMPKAPGEEASGQTLFSANQSFAFINAKCENMDLAKEFMKFLHTDEEMSRFSAKTSISRALNYKVDSEIAKTATSFGKNVIEMRNSSTVVYPYSALKVVIDNPTTFDEATWGLWSTVGGRVQKNPFEVFQKNKADAEEYFNGLYAYQKAQWKALK